MQYRHVQGIIQALTIHNGQQRHPGFLLPPEDTELSWMLVVLFPLQRESLYLE
jgi:hypothetical protein